MRDKFDGEYSVVYSNFGTRTAAATPASPKNGAKGGQSDIVWILWRR